MFFRSSYASAVVLTGIYGLLLSTASPALIAQQGQDADIAKALSGLPPEVLAHVRLASKDVVIPALIADEPLTVAARLIHQMVGDEELKNRLRYECGLQALKQGRPATALETADEITDFRAALLILEVAEKEAPASSSRVGELLQKAVSLTRTAKPWQADLIWARLVFVGALVKQDEADLRRWEVSIQDEEGRLMVAVGQWLQRAEVTGVLPLSTLEKLHQEFGMNKPLPGLLPMARRLLDRALEDDRMLDVNARARLVDSAVQLLRRSNVIRSELLVEAAIDSWKAGYPELARSLFVEAEKSLGAPYEESARLNCKLVRLWKLRGRAEDLIPVIEKEEGKARGLEQMFRPFAYAWLASSWEQAGRKDDALRLESEAVREAVSNVNPRTALLGAVHVCLAHAANGRPLAPGTVKAFAALLQGSRPQ